MSSTSCIFFPESELTTREYSEKIVAGEKTAAPSYRRLKNIEGVKKMLDKNLKKIVNIGVVFIVNINYKYQLIRN